MAGEIIRGGKRTRPTFNFVQPSSNTFDFEQIAAEMSESIRNIAEAQLAQQEVTNSNLCSIASILRRIDRRLSQQKGMKIR